MFTGKDILASARAAAKANGTSPSGKYRPVGKCCGKTYFSRTALAEHTRTKHQAKP